MSVSYSLAFVVQAQPFNGWCRPSTRGHQTRDLAWRLRGQSSPVPILHGPAGLTEDIWTFGTYEPLPFAAPKPWLMFTRSPGRGSWVIGAVLAADGSVTHEQSRMP